MTEYAERVRGVWRGGFRGAGTVTWETFSLNVSAPVKAGGSGGGASPSTLLVAAAGGCYLLSLAAALELRGFHPVRLELDSTGRLRAALPPELVAVEHCTRVVLPPAQAQRRASAARCFEYAKDTCLATRAMSGVEFTVRGTVKVEGEAPGSVLAEASHRADA